MWGSQSATETHSSEPDGFWKQAGDDLSSSPGWCLMPWNTRVHPTTTHMCTNTYTLPPPHTWTEQSSWCLWVCIQTSICTSKTLSFSSLIHHALLKFTSCVSLIISVILVAGQVLHTHSNTHTYHTSTLNTHTTSIPHTHPHKHREHNYTTPI